ncbi:hypothetical protein ABIQ69_09420 [Agromyces sp. G08B096]|uniref:Cell division protein FtsL n=1 Tax=Agromyces sp. G08B096 TaxID=3156399 RepID=A0AAU7W525_9MICO
MSAVPAQSLPIPAKRGEEKPHRRLRPVAEPGTRQRPKLVYAIIALGGIAVIVVVQLLFSVAMTEGAYEIDDYELRQVQLAREEQKLRETIDALESPQSVAQKAEALGMVPNAAPVYLRLSDGAVLGQPSEATGSAPGSPELVPNSLIDDLPSEQRAGGAAPGETGAEQAAAHAAGGSAAGAAGSPVVPADGLPTPATH